MKTWFFGLLAAVINGVATAITLVLTGLAQDPTSGEIQWAKLGTACVILALWGLGNYLKTSPLPREVWTPEERSARMNGGKIAVVLLLALVLPQLACHDKPLNIQTNPVGTVAHYSTQIVTIVQAAQDAVIAAEAAKIPGVTVERIAPFIRATIQVGQKAQELATALTELDALPIGDLTRPTKIKAVGVILASTQAIVFNMVVPVGDDPLLIKIRDLVREVSVLLLTIQQELVPPENQTARGGMWQAPSPVLVRAPYLAVL